jgi:uncharacterized protein involved in exopolysaccharide biosynthesis
MDAYSRDMEVGAMKFLCGKPGLGFLCCLGGLMLVIGLFSLPALLPGAVEAQTPGLGASPAIQTPAVPDSAPPAASTLVLPQQGATARDAGESFPKAYAPVTTTPRPALPAALAPEMMRSRSIDQLLQELQVLRAQKAELERQEKEIVASVKERLMEQKQKLQTLGVQMEEPGRPPIEGARYEAPRIDDGRK